MLRSGLAGVATMKDGTNLADAVIIVSKEIPVGTVGVMNRQNGTLEVDSVTISATYSKYEGIAANARKTSRTLKGTDIAMDIPEMDLSNYSILQYATSNTTIILVHPSIIESMAREIALDGVYRQASLFFKDQNGAKNAVKNLLGAGYIAVTSDTTYNAVTIYTILGFIQGVYFLLIWLGMVVFLAFFIRLTTSRAVNAFQQDLGILRSMGIPVLTIRSAMYVRMYLATIPAILGLILLSAVVYSVPSLSSNIRYLGWLQQGLILLGLMMIATRVTHRQVKGLFGVTVRKALKRGDIR